ncbi:hypothetical protein MTO96_000534 [Rhipicephalus appendiculatus]
MQRNTVHGASQLNLPGFVHDALSLGPKFAVEKKRPPEELLPMVRQLARLVPDEEASRVVSEETFRGLLLSDRNPVEPPQPYTADETRIVCPIGRVPEISRRAHHDGSLHRSRLLAVTIRHTITRPPQPPPAPTTVEAAVTFLRSGRPDLLVHGAISAPISVSPLHLPPQPPVDDLLDFKNEPLLVEGEGVVWVTPWFGRR